MTDNTTRNYSKITQEDWNSLVELIPIIERTENFGEFIEPTKMSDNFYIYKGFKTSRIVDEFFHRTYQNNFIYDFDWMQWKEGKELIENPKTNFSLFDLPTLSKMIIAIIRGDKYCDGFLIGKFKDGTILKILKAVQARLTGNRVVNDQKELNEKLNKVSKVLFIKLGKGGRFAQECIENNYLKLSYDEVNHELCANGQWDSVKEYFINTENTTKQVATNHTNQIKQFYTESEKTLWITFVDNKLWWCFSKPTITKNRDNTKTRPTVGKWSDKDIFNSILFTSNLSGKLLKTHGYQGTICNISEKDYVLTKLKGEERIEVVEVKEALKNLTQKLSSLIPHLQWQDFEILIDLIFRQMGWQRVSVLGKELKTLDIELFSPVTEERAVVQIKTGANLSSFKSYVEQFSTMKDYDKFFYIASSPADDLRNYKNDSEKIKLYLTEDVAKLTISSGLINWVIKKTN